MSKDPQIKANFQSHSRKMMKLRTQTKFVANVILRNFWVPIYTTWCPKTKGTKGTSFHYGRIQSDSNCILKKYES